MSLKPIAIVGISAEIPGGPSAGNLDYEQFFDFLLNKGQAYEKIPQQRFNIEAWQGKNLGQVSTNRGTFLHNLNLFDNTEFGITTKDARSMSLSNRKLIEHAFLALLDSGIDYRGRNVGCFMSGINMDSLSLSDNDEFEARGSLTGAPAMMANRVSYHLDLTGPSVPTDTACSSSLTALHLAIQSIRAGDCEAAIGGGAQLNHRLADYVQYSQASILSPDGKCKPFDSSANGFSRGEGVCVIVVKLLEDALRDKDYIYASVLGTGINSSGAAAPVNAPVAEAQAEAMVRAYKGTGRQPSEVDFIELHATGTAAGDPVEANWVGERFYRGTEILMGSVKGNVGHLEIVSFLASLCKVCSMFRTGLVPPNVNLHNPNPMIQWDRFKMKVPTEVIPLPVRSSSGRALVSMTSSGIGGANGHAVVEAPPKRQISLINGDPNMPVLLVAGGLSPRSAAVVAEDLTNMVMPLQKDQPNHDPHLLATIFGRRSRQFTWRTFSVWQPQLKKSLNFLSPKLVLRKHKPLVFVFSGQGPQHFQMGRQLYQTYLPFQQTIDKLDQIYLSATGTSMINTYGLFAHQSRENPFPEIWPINITLPALAMVQIAMFDLLVELGIRPDVVVGHSAGETALLYASGSASKEMALEIAIARGEAMATTEDDRGTMAALNCTSDIATSLIKEVVSALAEGEKSVEIACYNAPESVTIAGHEDLVDEVLKVAKSQGVGGRKLRTRVAVHSSMMEGCSKSYIDGVQKVFARYPQTSSPTVTTYSSSTSERWLSPYNPTYFWQNARDPVLFSKMISSVQTDFPNAIFMEISPHAVLSSSLVELGADKEQVLCPMRRVPNPHPYYDVEIFLTSLGLLATLGYNGIDYCALNHVSQLNHVEGLPRYPFLRKDLPLFSEAFATRRFKVRRGPLHDPDCVFVNSLTHPELVEHTIRNEHIMPASGFLEMIFELGARVMWNIEFKSILPIFSDKLLRMKVHTLGHHWNVESSVRGVDRREEQPARSHASGYYSNEFIEEPSANPEQWNMDSIRSRCQKMKMDGFYESLSYFAQYGPKYQRVTECYLNEEEALMQVNCATSDIPEIQNYIIHPAVLDACFHIMVHPAFTANSDRNTYYLPSRVRQVILHQPDIIKYTLPSTIYSYVMFKKWEPEFMEWDVAILSSEGSLLCQFFGIQVARHFIDPQLPFSTKYYDLMDECVASIPSSMSQNAVSLSSDIIHLPSVLSVVNFPATSSQLEEPLIVKFQLEEVISIQSTLRNARKSGRTCIWFEATLDVDGFAAQGFTRSLRKEVFPVAIRLVLFHKIWDANARSALIQRLSAQPDLDHEIFVDAVGDIHVPRVLVNQSSITSDSIVTHPLRNQTSSPHVLLKDLMMIHITTVAPSGGLFQGFCGIVKNPGTTGWEIDSAVVGVAKNCSTGDHVVHRGQIATIPDNGDAAWYASVAVPIIILHLAFGSEWLDDLTALRSRHIAISEGGKVASILNHILLQIGAPVTLFPQGVNSDVISCIARSDVVMSGCTALKDIQFIDSALHSDASAYFWNSPDYGIAHAMKLNPFLFGNALRRGLSTTSPLFLVSRPVYGNFIVENSVMPSHIGVSAGTLFSGDKCYILIGGIGSIGLHVALWMYQNGARRLVLTSRSGRKSLYNGQNTLGLRMLQYLETKEDIDLQLVKCDASSKTATQKLIQNIPHRIGGCILMSAVLNDRLFTSHTWESFSASTQPKVDAFQAFESAIDIGSLDFFVSLSSAMIFGNIGQTNYAAGNTAMDGLVKKYDNAFSLILPGISDSTMIREDHFTPSVFNSFMKWAMTCQEVCDCIGNGIRAMESGQRLWLYIPDLKWNEVQRHLGKSDLYDHLCIESNRAEDFDTTSIHESPSSTLQLQGLVLRLLDVSVDDFSPDVPLTVYGLDSLIAGRLAHDLKPYIAISQLQLLADLCLRDLEQLLKEAETKSATTQDGEHTTIYPTSDHFQTVKEETIIKLVEAEGVPLILIHGVSGDVAPFRPLQSHLTTPLWAIQITPQTPTQSLQSIASYYKDQIKQERPLGPYRLGAYSEMSLLGYMLAMMLNDGGDDIEQFVLIDHSPMLYVSPELGLDEESIQTGLLTQNMLDKVVGVHCHVYLQDNLAKNQKIAIELTQTHLGYEAGDWSANYYSLIKRHYSLVVKFFAESFGKETDVPMDMENMKVSLCRWLQKLDVPTTIIVASKGTTSYIQDLEWRDYGIGAYLPNARVVRVDETLFGLFTSKHVAEILEDL